MKTKVLFLCTGNSARSIMAEAILRHYAGDRFEPYSAGMEPKGINPYTVRVLDEIGVSVEGMRSKDVREYMGHKYFGYLIIVCGDADKSCPTIFPGVGERMLMKFDDPAAFEGREEDKLNKFREIRDEIKASVLQWANQVEPVLTAPR
jgi:arsenate reductase (thioredoxin)